MIQYNTTLKIFDRIITSIFVYISILLYCYVVTYTDALSGNDFLLFTERKKLKVKV